MEEECIVTGMLLTLFFAFLLFFFWPMIENFTLKKVFILAIAMLGFYEISRFGYWFILTSFK